MADVRIELGSQAQGEPPRYEDIYCIQGPQKNKDRGHVKLELGQTATGAPGPPGLKPMPPGATKQKPATKPVKELKLELGTSHFDPKECTKRVRKYDDDNDVPLSFRRVITCLYYFLVVYSLMVIIVWMYLHIDDQLD